MGKPADLTDIVAGLTEHETSGLATLALQMLPKPLAVDIVARWAVDAEEVDTLRAALDTAEEEAED